MSEKITIADMKAALNDEEFRKTLPEELKEDLEKYLRSPNCGCNVKSFQRILSVGSEQFAKRYPEKVVQSLD
jgi:hypothetical protein